MSPAVTKTFYLILIIGIGYLMQKKIASKDQREGIKNIILSLALPATIFIALLKIEFSAEMIIVPILALVFNLILFGIMDRVPLRPLLNIPETQYRSLTLLIPSLAPGLSCFPFIVEYSSEGALALAALADVGNKVFVLIVAYSVAMQWYFRINRIGNTTRASRMKDLIVSLVGEPVNTVILSAILMLALGLNFESLPNFIQMSVDRISLMMTPLILLFIGISMKLTLQQVRTIGVFLFFRSGLAFLLSGILLIVLPINDIATMLLVVVFPQSACSFWPFAHMAAVSNLEKRQHETERTFDLDFALNVLACSLPFSVTLILGIYTTGDFFARPGVVFASGAICLGMSALPMLFSIRRSERLVLTNKTEQS
ncbi:MAG: AEC family transporter [Bacteroidota bacterium]|jgi:predicted permease|nr:MAG: permease [Bacteroidota bacterium]